MFRLLTQYRRPIRLFLVLLRLLIFQLARFVTFIMRILLAENYTKVLNGQASINEGLIIGEQVLLGIGFLIPVFVLIRLAGYHSGRNKGEDVRGKKKREATWILEIALIVAIIFGIVAGTNTSGALNNPSTAKEVKTDRIVSSAIALAVLAVLFLYCVFLAARPNFPRSTSLWIGLTSALLIVVPVYRLQNTIHHPLDASSTENKAKFYILQITVEWLVGASILSVNIKEWCGIEDDRSRSPSEDITLLGQKPVESGCNVRYTFGNDFYLYVKMLCCCAVSAFFQLRGLPLLKIAVELMLASVFS
ncbi:hypothetical protein EW146_g353 [Bondarzewia mesenterica]|uniref:Uncharacterized protein n=1 Tax=Bondarzewia mesenterica TaxID=1095465 RepID=A0A4S4M8W5_9AGAM|nr:hypothetical protein EW146_g353 [Bondarzewia mesenterica]